MQTFVVRVYRRAHGAAPARRAQDRVALTGIVEHPDSGASSAFHGVEELWAALVANGVRPSKRRKRG